MLICLSGVSGAGKNTIMEELTRKWDLHNMPTATTRMMRETEFEGHPYVYLTPKEFAKRQKQGDFIETKEVHRGTMYGTLRSIHDTMLNDGKIMITDIDVDGAEFLRSQGFDILWIFIKTPTLDDLQERLAKRGNTPEDIKRRLSRAEHELQYETKTDYVIVNDVLSTAVEDCEQIIEKELKKRGLKLVPNKRKDFIVVYNNKAGKGKSAAYARKICEELAKTSDVELVNSRSEEFIHEYFAKKLPQQKDVCVVAVGGDGTLGTTIDAILKAGTKASVAVFPCGTANDFSRSAGIKRRLKSFISLINTSSPTKADVALVNNKVYSIHAVGAGSFGHGSMEFSSIAKKKYGMMAYWLKCFFKAFKMKSQKLTVSIDDKTITDDFLFFYCTNGTVAGGFHSFAPKAQINDGKFDFVAIKKCNIFTFSWIVAKLLIGKHSNSKHVVMIPGKNIQIKAEGKVDENFVGSDVDGNVGPKLPLNIQVQKQKILIYTQKR